MFGSTPDRSDLRVEGLEDLPRVGLGLVTHGHFFRFLEPVHQLVAHDPLGYGLLKDGEFTLLDFARDPEPI